MTAIPPIAQLRARCQSLNRPFSWSEALQRKVSIYITALVLRTPLTANQITVISILIGLTGGVLLAIDNTVLAVIGASLFVAWETLDCVDGEVSRFRGTSSLTGLYLDRLHSTIVGPYQFLFAGIAGYHITGSISALLFGAVAALARPIGSLASSQMQISALEPLLYNYRSDPLREHQVDDDAFTPDIHYVSVEGGGFVRKVAWFFYNGIGRHFLLVFVVFYDRVIDPGPTLLPFSLTWLFLAGYALLSTIAWLGLMFLIVKRRSTEAYYAKIRAAVDRAARVG